MNKDFEKPEIAEVYCNCSEGKKNPSYVFINSIEEEFSSVCRFCNKTIYNVTCSNSKCGTEYSFPTGAKELNESENNWKCPDCNKINSLSNAKNNRLVSYLKTDIPEDIFKKLVGTNMLASLGKSAYIKVFIILAIIIGGGIVISMIIDLLIKAIT